MYYNLIKTPALIKTGTGLIKHIEDIIRQAHLFYPSKTLITQENLFNIYKDEIPTDIFNEVIFCKGGDVSEVQHITEKINNKDALIFAFGGGSVLDIVKYSASKCDLPYITVPSTLSNDAIYSCVARLNDNGKKRSYGVQPPTGIIVDLDIIKKSPKELILAGVGDLITNLSAIQDWKLAYKNINEPINELAYMLAKEAATLLFEYSEKDLYTNGFLKDLANGLISSGLSMIISGNTRGTSGAEHLISHAIDEFFNDKSSIHGLQAAWGFLMIERHLRKNNSFYDRLSYFYDNIGLTECLNNYIIWGPDDFYRFIPYARRIRNRYTIFNTIDAI